MALPGKAGRNFASMMSGAKRGAFARSPVTPSAAKRGVFAQSPSAAKKGIFAFSPGGGQSFAPSSTSFAPSLRQAEDQSMQLLQQRRDQTRRDFFDNRQDISNNRLDRRQIQADLLDQFKNKQMQRVGETGIIDPITGELTGALFQSRTPGGPTLADESMRLANMYGPTFKEIGSDIRYGLSQIGKGLAEKGSPMMNLAKSFIGGIQDFFMPTQPPRTTDQFAEFKQGMNTAQVGLFNYYINRGNSPEFARNAALSGVVPQMAMGGVASL